MLVHLMIKKKDKESEIRKNWKSKQVLLKNSNNKINRNRKKHLLLNNKIKNKLLNPVYSKMTIIIALKLVCCLLVNKMTKKIRIIKNKIRMEKISKYLKK